MDRTVIIEDGKQVVSQQLHTAAPKPRHQGDATPMNIAGGAAFNPLVDRRYWIAWDVAAMWLEQYDGPGAAWRTAATGHAGLGFQVSFYQEHDPNVPDDGAYRIWNNGAPAIWVSVSWEVEV